MLGNISCIKNVETLFQSRIRTGFHYRSWTIRMAMRKEGPTRQVCSLDTMDGSIKLQDHIPQQLTLCSARLSLPSQ